MFSNGSCVFTKSGSEYQLGLVDSSYERRYPGSLQRLLARLKLASRPQTETPELACAGPDPG